MRVFRRKTFFAMIIFIEVYSANNLYYYEYIYIDKHHNIQDFVIAYNFNEKLTLYCLKVCSHHFVYFELIFLRHFFT